MMDSESGRQGSKKLNRKKVVVYGVPAKYLKIGTKPWPVNAKALLLVLIRSFPANYQITAQPLSFSGLGPVKKKVGRQKKSSCTNHFCPKSPMSYQSQLFYEIHMDPVALTAGPSR